MLRKRRRLARPRLILAACAPIIPESGNGVSTNGSGERVSAVILRISRVFVPASHQVIHVILSDGREFAASPGHHTADARALGDVKVNALLDGARVLKIEHLRYAGNATFDLLPSGDTGFYWANGILMGSTLSDN